jgi:hypothetical protein
VVRVAWWWVHHGSKYMRHGFCSVAGGRRRAARPVATVELSCLMCCLCHLFAASWTKTCYRSNVREGGRQKLIGRSKSSASNGSRPGGCLLINPRGIVSARQTKIIEQEHQTCTRLNKLDLGSNNKIDTKKIKVCK